MLKRKEYKNRGYAKLVNPAFTLNEVKYLGRDVDSFGTQTLTFLVNNKTIRVTHDENQWESIESTKRQLEYNFVLNKHSA